MKCKCATIAPASIIAAKRQLHREASMATRSGDVETRDFHALYVDAELEFAAGAVTGPWGHSPGLALARSGTPGPEPAH